MVDVLTKWIGPLHSCQILYSYVFELNASVTAVTESIFFQMVFVDLSCGQSGHLFPCPAKRQEAFPTAIPCQTGKHASLSEHLKIKTQICKSLYLFCSPKLHFRNCHSSTIAVGFSCIGNQLTLGIAFRTLYLLS